MRNESRQGGTTLIELSVVIAVLLYSWEFYSLASRLGRTVQTMPPASLIFPAFVDGPDFLLGAAGGQATRRGTYPEYSCS
jgi:hypothetical protein